MRIVPARGDIPKGLYLCLVIAVKAHAVLAIGWLLLIALEVIR